MADQKMKEDSKDNSADDKQNQQENDDNKPKAKKGLLKYAIIIAVIGLSSALLYSFLINYIKAIPEVIVPEVIGMEKEEAILILQQNKLNPYLGGSRFSEENTPNIILETDPEPGRKVKAGRTVRYILNIGQEQINLPEIKGLYPNQAENLLKPYNISLHPIVEEHSLEYKEGTIIATSPNAGDYVNKSSTVDISISKGFPVEISFQEIQEGDNRLLAKITLKIPHDTATKKTNVKIMSISKDSPKILFNEDIPSGKELVFEFEERIGNKIDVFYNDILAKTGIVLF